MHAQIASDAVNRPTAPETENDLYSYSIGYQIGSNLLNQNARDLNLTHLINGLKDSYQHIDPLIDEEQLEIVISEYKIKLTKRINEARKRGEAEQQAFFDKLKKNDNIKQTESGLFFTSEKQTDGPRPDLTSFVTLHLTASNLNGKVFESTELLNQPIAFPLASAIPGLQEGIQMMSNGSDFTFYIPFKLGFGSRGYKNLLDPYSGCIYRVKLISFN